MIVAISTTRRQAGAPQLILYLHESDSIRRVFTHLNTFGRDCQWCFRTFVNRNVRQGENVSTRFVDKYKSVPRIAQVMYLEGGSIVDTLSISYSFAVFLITKSKV